MKRYWFRALINENPRKVVKVLIQAPSYEEASEWLKDTIEEYYPGYSLVRILNSQDILEDDKCYIVFGDGDSMHYMSK